MYRFIYHDVSHKSNFRLRADLDVLGGSLLRMVRDTCMLAACLARARTLKDVRAQQLQEKKNVEKAIMT